uniref:Uncharacterized protein n=2 Tax=Tetranychus urticae TaxID=32264 RepID=T1KJ01_TETUR
MKFITNNVRGKNEPYVISDYGSYAGNSILELDEQIVGIGGIRDNCVGNRLMCKEAPISETMSTNTKNYLVTALENKIYILKNGPLIQFNVANHETKEFSCSYKGISVLIPMPSHDKVILFNSRARFCDCFDVKNETWMTIGLLADGINYTDDHKKSNDRMITFASTFLQRDIIRHFNNPELMA